MTANDRFIGLLEDYLDRIEGSTPLPDRVRDAIHAELPGIRQVRPRPGLRRVSTMLSETPLIARWGMAAALIIAVALGAAILADGSPRVGPSPSPTATLIPTPSPVALQSAPPAACSSGSAMTCIGPGVYGLGAALPRDATIAVPPGWYEWDYGAGSLGLLVERPDAGSGSGYGIQFMRVGDVARDPCDPAAGNFRASDVDTPTKLIAAMASWPGFTASVPEPVTVGGTQGLSTTVRPTTAGPACGAGMIWRTSSGAAVDGYPMVGAGADGYPATFRILDIDGQLVAIRTMASAATSPFELQQGIPNDPERHAADLVALDSIVQSLRFADAAPSATPTAISGPTASD